MPSEQIGISLGSEQLCIWLSEFFCLLSVLVYFAVYGYVICDHMRALLVYMSALDGSCPLVGIPCSTYEDFLKGNCVTCDVFQGACPHIGKNLPLLFSQMLSC